MDRPVICLSRVEAAYEGERAATLRDVDLMVEEGELLAIVGPNGAGKTTLLDVIDGLLPVTAGEVRVFGAAVGPHAHRLRRRIGYLPQDLFFPPSTPYLVRDVVLMARFGDLPPFRFVRRADREAVAGALAAVGLSGLSRRPIGRLGALFPVAMALGFVFLTRTESGGIGSGALSLLWGSVLGMTMDQVGLLGIVALVIVVAFIGFGRGFFALLLDRRLAIASGLNARAYYYGVLVLVAIVVSVSLRITGGLLIYALMVLPATSAFQWAYDIKKIFLIAPLLGGVSAFGGFLFSLWADLPIGSAIALCAAGLFLISTAMSPKRRRER